MPKGQLWQRTLALPAGENLSIRGVCFNNLNTSLASPEAIGGSSIITPLIKSGLSQAAIKDTTAPKEWPTT